jgi:sugar-specific transcriptional regulator TrmB
VYKALEQLESMGLVSQKGGKGSVAVFSPNHPSLLLSSFDQKEKELALAKESLESAIGGLASKWNLIAGKPNVQFYEGEEAIAKITGDLPREDREIRQFIDIGAALEQFPEATLGYLQKRVAKGISKRMIVPDTERNRAYVEKGSELTEFQIAKGMSELPTAIQVYDSTVSMLTLTEAKRVGLLIEDKEIADTIKILFDGYWNNKSTEATPPSSV